MIYFVNCFLNIIIQNIGLFFNSKFIYKRYFKNISFEFFVDFAYHKIGLA